MRSLSETLLYMHFAAMHESAGGTRQKITAVQQFRLVIEALPPWDRSEPQARTCRVGPGNFTPSLSQIRTGYSRIIRLVPPREGCRLPLNEGLVPANRLAQINGDAE